jgi:hypothetical protein
VRLAGSTPRFVAAAVACTALLTTIVFWATEHEQTEVPSEITGCPPPPMPAFRRRVPDGMPVVALIDSVARSLDGAFLSLAREHD